MQYFTEQGPSHLEAVRKIKEKYGDRAKIMTHRNIRIGGFLGLFTREGVEISGYISNEEPMRKKRELQEEKNRILSAAAAFQSGGNGGSRGPEAFGISLPVSGEESERPAGKASASPEKTGEMELVLKELREIREQVSRQETGAPEEHPSLEKISELLSDNDFSYGFIKETVGRLKSELSLAELDDFEGVQHRVVSWIAEKITVYPEPERQGHRRIILIGPTGVGKTTTIAKLAAMTILGDPEEKARSVRMITIDNYRIGARGQLETYGDIMNIPVASVETREEMKKKLALFEDVDTIFVDTTGRCPRDFRNIAAMRELLEPCGSRAEYFLAVSATTKASDVKEILREFESFGYAAVVLTKLDETQRIGNIISILSELNKPLAYITFGQGVPADIEKAEPLRLLKNLEGFTIHIEKLKEEQSLGSGR